MSLESSLWPLFKQQQPLNSISLIVALLASLKLNFLLFNTLFDLFFLPQKSFLLMIRILEQEFSANSVWYSLCDDCVVIRIAFPFAYILIKMEKIQ